MKKFFSSAWKFSTLLVLVFLGALWLFRDRPLVTYQTHHAETTAASDAKGSAVGQAVLPLHFPPVPPREEVAQPKLTPKALLAEIDKALDAVQRDESTSAYGSYSDWFIPSLRQLRDQKVPRAKLNARIDRLAKLARQKKYLSSYEQGIVEDSGVDQLRADAMHALDVP